MAVIKCTVAAPAGHRKSLNQLKAHLATHLASASRSMPSASGTTPVR